MNTTTTGASHTIPGTFSTPPLRRRAELPALPRAAYQAQHDFLVPNARPDLANEADTGAQLTTTEVRAALPAQAEFTPRPRIIEPDSIFWSPEVQSSDAA